MKENHDNHNKKMGDRYQSSSIHLLPNVQKQTLFHEERDILMRSFLTNHTSIYEEMVSILEKDLHHG